LFLRVRSAGRAGEPRDSIEWRNNELSFFAEFSRGAGPMGDTWRVHAAPERRL